MKELLFSVTRKDLDITYYSGTGAGGQHRNKHMNCVRIRHPESGALVTAQEERSKDKNFKMAFRRLTEHPKFNIWLKMKAGEMMIDKAAEEREINRRVDIAMREENIKVEYLEIEDEDRSTC